MTPSLLHLNTVAVAVASVKVAEHDNVNRVQLLEKTRNSRVLVLGGTDRVGGSTATALSNLCPYLRIVIGGRNRCGSSNSCCRTFSTGIEMHCSGSYHRDPGEAKTAYLDVCNDTSYAFRAKSFKDKVVDANIPAITIGGIYLRVSNVMAIELVSAIRNESKGKPERLRFSYYTASTGDAGPTILATSFLLLERKLLH
ncbi:hypothetical protein PTKIN_Ptkin03bG0100100 [Pterospermum kingtungense]